MIATRRNTLLLTVALVATAACSKKPPKELPPAPPSQIEQPSGNSGNTGPVGSGVVPGSRADFLQTVGEGQGDRVYFDTDQYDLSAEARSTLDRQIEWLRRYPNVRATVEGHADERGTREYNLALGDRRANSVKNYLVAQGVSTARINVISYGKERPEVPGSDEGAWARNRRAVTVVIQ